MEQYKSILEMGLWVVVATMGWVLRELWGAVKELRHDLHQIEKDLPTQYIHKDDFNLGISQIRQDLQIVFKKIDNLRDNKADK
jgi:hypothetical protein